MGPLLGTLNIRCRMMGPKRDHNFDNHPFKVSQNFLGL